MTDIEYEPSRVLHDTRLYDINQLGAFNSDEVATYTVEDLAGLAASDDWRDRVRAEWLRQNVSITLPDQFPCIYETAESPTKQRHARKVDTPWVKSANEEMLHELLPIYQEAWHHYTKQWGPESQRTFAVGRLDGMSARGVFRPEATVADVMASTLLTHSDIYYRGPDHIKRYHPQYENWHKNRSTS